MTDKDIIFVNTGTEIIYKLANQTQNPINAIYKSQCIYPWNTNLAQQLKINCKTG